MKVAGDSLSARKSGLHIPPALSSIPLSWNPDTEIKLMSCTATRLRHSNAATCKAELHLNLVAAADRSFGRAKPQHRVVIKHEAVRHGTPAGRSMRLDADPATKTNRSVETAQRQLWRGDQLRCAGLSLSASGRGLGGS